MSAEALNIVKELKTILGRNNAQIQENKWANFIDLFEKIILLIESNKEVLNSIDNVPQDVTIGNLAKILDEFINKFRNELFRWCLKNSDLCWSETLKCFDEAIERHLPVDVVDNLSKYRQWRRRNPDADEAECTVSRNRFQAAREIQKFTDYLQIALMRLKSRFLK